MIFPDERIPEISESTRPVCIFRNKDGTFKSGFVLKKNEFVTNMETLTETCKKTGLFIVDRDGNKL